MNRIQEPIVCEADALREIIEWSKDRPLWQREALRRLLCSQDELTEQDMFELTELCQDSDRNTELCAFDHVVAQYSGSHCVSIRSISGVANVNALAKDQTLNFIPKGVTIVYGDNGAGKSGYVRILKIACRARVVQAKDEVVLSNIFETVNEAQVAELEFAFNDQVKRFQWKNGETSASLSEIRIFDSRIANIYVEQTNGLQYTPYPMKVLERLVALCKLIKIRLEEDVSTIKAQTPQVISIPSCSSETQVGQLLASIGKDTKFEYVEALATLSKEEQKRLVELSFYIGQDVEVYVRKLRTQRDRLKIIRGKLQVLGGAISEQRIQDLQDLALVSLVKDKTALLTAQSISRDSILNGVGSESWCELLKAAKAYSEQMAYPKESFPAYCDRARCVLCQQELMPEGIERLGKFEKFMQERTQIEKIEARKKLDEARNSILNASLSFDFIRSELRFVMDEIGQKIAHEIRSYIVQAKWIIRTILRQNGELGVLNVPKSIDRELQTILSSLDSQIQVLLDEKKDEELNTFKKELAELKDRQWLAGVKKDLYAEIKRKNSIFKIETAIEDTKSNLITQKNTALSEVLISERLRTRFVEEVKKFELTGLGMDLHQISSKEGVSRFQIRLIRSKSKDKASEILSEGEHRCAALAVFMAELAMNDNGSGIIFDDPVSSLDHLHREAIALRLAREGRERQVVVFTHDLPFLYMLERACQHADPLQKTEVALRHIQKRQGVPGYCRNEAPEKAQKVTLKLIGLRKHLINSSQQYITDPDSLDWLIKARGLVDSIRQAWEAAIEDVISPVLRTFSSRVDTKGFIQLSAIKEEDAVRMRKHYGNCSELLHKASDAMNPVAPKPEEIEEELDAIDDWIKHIASRQKQLK